ncbi:MAG TPA: TrmH family RNA methyltransferase [Candidatus Angelobacter sp.]|nr:TrmH family RNA methyltransferase [Candidatus Angelobacter sp.]
MRPLAEFDRLSVVLVNTRNPLNIGAAARAMSNFGFRDLRLVNPFEPSFREARSAVGASATELLAGAREYPSVADAVGDCNLVIGTTAAARRELQHPLRSLGEAETTNLIRRKLSRGRIALLFGSEKRGLSNEDFSHCHWLLRIPTREGQGSMNLGQAVAVCLYEIARISSRPGKAKGGARAAAKPGKGSPATVAETERITTLLLEALRGSGYLAARPASSADERVRRMVRRLDLSSSDAQVWLGMLRQIAWKINKFG